MKDDKKLFRKAMSGFNKADVMSYIDGLNEQLKENEKRIEEITRQNAAKVNELNANIKSLEDKCASLEEALNKKHAELLEAQKYSAIASQDVSKLKYQFEQERTKTYEYARKIKEYEDLIPILKDKADKYERQMSKISEVLVAVRQESDSIIETAKTEAKEIREQVKEELKTIGAYIEEAKRAYSSLRNSINEQMLDINEKFGEGFKGIDALDNKLKDLDGLIKTDEEDGLAEELTINDSIELEKKDSI